MFDLNDDNFLIYAAKAYDKPTIVSREFEDDLSRLKYVKRLLRKYRQSGDLRERLILNHIIILANVFGVEATVNMLFFKVDNEDYPPLKTILLFLNYMPDRIPVTFNKYQLKQADITVDLEVAKKLREI